MMIQFLDIGIDTQQLSACRLSLMLGVHQAQDNRVHEILRFACKVLHAEQALWIFEHEPYFWHYQHQQLRAIKVQPCHLGKRDLNICVTGCSSGYLKQLGLEHARHINMDIEVNSHVMGQVYIFDDGDGAFDEDAIVLVKEYLRTVIEMIQLREENYALKEAYEEQASLSNSKTKYFQILAHDLRAPFHGLLGFTDVLLNEHDSLSHDEQHDIREYLNDTAQSMYQLLERVLAWAMADGGRFTYNPINFRVKETVNIVFEVLGGLATKKGIQLVNDIEEGIQIYADINMMTSVIQNLVSNAIKFMPLHRDGVIRVWSKRQDAKVHIYVQDTGMGMSKTQLERLFQPVLTMRSQGTDGEASAGLGLVLCKRFMDLNFGEISVKSEEMQGTTFKLSLPTALYSSQTQEDVMLSKQTVQQ